MSKNKELVRIVKFVLFSASAGIIQVASFAVLNDLIGLKYFAAYLISLVLSVLWNFTLNRRFTFYSANNIPIAMLKVAVFYLIFTPLSTWGGNYLTTLSVNDYIVLAISMGTNFVTEFLWDKYIVFKGSIDSTLKK